MGIKRSVEDLDKLTERVALRVFPVTAVAILTEACLGLVLSNGLWRHARWLGRSLGTWH